MNQSTMASRDWIRGFIAILNPIWRSAGDFYSTGFPLAAVAQRARPETAIEAPKLAFPSDFRIRAGLSGIQTILPQIPI
jgi:hypothetical protein